jgi:hypothetical protein
MSKNFLAMRGTAPFKPPKQKGAHPSSGNSLMYHFHRSVAENVVTFFNNISHTKNSVGGLNRAFSHCLRPRKGGRGKKAVKTCHMREMVKVLHATLAFNITDRLNLNTYLIVQIHKRKPYFGLAYAAKPKHVKYRELLINIFRYYV